MNPKLTEIPGAITAPKGFRTGAVFCNIKRLGTGKGSDKGQKRDLALILSDAPAAAAGLFTTNQICAAPVKVCIEHLQSPSARAIVVNSGNANACTGRQGLKDARDMARLTAATLNKLASTSANSPAAKIAPSDVFVASTGRIGVLLPMPEVQQGILAAAEVLGDSPAHAAQTAEAIMTSDTRPKQIAIEFLLGGKTARIGGICKGAGMIQPGMSPNGQRPPSAPAGLHATMLGFLTTDASVHPAFLQSALQEAVARSFNRITVDGDMSTNDTVLLLANGLAENPTLQSRKKPSPAERRDQQTFQAALNLACLKLAQMIVRDGEGVTRFVTVQVQGAASFADADAAARAVANSSLVKTSWHGGDPNWGRIIDAIGYSPARVVESKVDIGYSLPNSKTVLWSLRRGQPTSTPFADLWKLVQAPEFTLHIRLNLGKASALMYAADLTEAYVDFNKGAIADPSLAGSLGG